MALSKECYDTSGKGFCVVLANFTSGDNKLTGYQHDIEGIQSLFKESKLFDVDFPDVFLNLSQAEFRKAVKDIQHQITNCNETYSFFLMFVLSHGHEDGFLMCDKSSLTYKPERKDGKLCCIGENELIQSFTHDKVPKLRGIPKCFFFQACRGSGEVETAATPQFIQKQQSNFRPRDILKANILVMHSTLESTHSYVERECGSLFIKPLLKELKMHATSKHMLEILTSVTANVEIRAPYVFFPLNGKGYNMKVKYEDKERSIKMVGKHGDIHNIPLHTKTGQKTRVSYELDHYSFTGNATHRENKEPPQCLSNVDADLLAQYNQADYEIYGEITSKVNQQSKRNGSVVIENNQPKVEGEVVPHTENDTKFEILLSVEGFDNNFKPEILQGQEVTCSHRLTERFTLTKKDDLWGVESVAAQLPFVTSTLLSKLYIVKVGDK